MSQVPFDRHGRCVLLPDGLQQKVHGLGVKHNMSCDAVVALIVERYFRLPCREREFVENAIYDGVREARRTGKRPKLVVTFVHMPDRRKKAKRAKLVKGDA